MSKRVLIIIFIISTCVLLISGCLDKSQKSQETKTSTKKSTPSAKLAFDKEAASTDPFNDENGPYYHKVYKATSKDGLNYKRVKEVVLDKASVPDVVKNSDGHLFVYAVDGSGRSDTDVMVAISKDNGKTFDKGSIRIIGKGDIEALADPQVVLADDGRIRLFYVVFPKNKPPLDESGKPIPTGDKIKIKSALSKDGFNFEEEEGSRYETTDIITDSDIVKIGSKWFMYLSEGRKNVATSSVDGKTFKLEKTIREEGSISKTVAIGGNKYRQFFCEKGISSAITTDGLSWTDESGSRLKEDPGEIICDPSPVRVGDEWIMFFKSAPMSDNPAPPPPPE